MADQKKIQQVRKRDGRIVPFDRVKIADAIFKAAQSVGGQDRYLAQDLSEAVTMYLEREFQQKTPSVEEIQDIVEKVLIKTGHAKTAKAYILYRERRTRIRRVRKGFPPDDTGREEDDRRTTELREIPLSVRTSDETINRWDRSRIIETLIRETGISRNIAEIIVTEVEDEVVASKIAHLSSSLIRELVNGKLVQYGFDDARRKHARLGIPVHDVAGLFATHGAAPVAMSEALGGHIKKEFGLSEVFPPPIADAHLRGDIHIHHLEGIDAFSSLVCRAEDLAALSSLPRPERPEERFLRIGGGVRKALSFCGGTLRISGLFPFPGPVTDIARLREAFFTLLGDETGSSLDIDVPLRSQPDPAIGVFLECYRLLLDQAPPLPSLHFSCAAALWETEEGVSAARLMGDICRRRGGRVAFGPRQDEGGGESVLGDVTINLPRAALLAGEDETVFRMHVERFISAAVTALRRKQEFWSGTAAAAKNETGLFPREGTMHRLSLTGLAETVFFRMETLPEESDAAFRRCFSTIETVRSIAEETAARQGITVQVVANADRQAGRRLADIDRASFPERFFPFRRRGMEGLLYRDFPAQPLPPPAALEEGRRWESLAGLLRGLELPVLCGKATGAGEIETLLKEASSFALLIPLLFQPD